MSLFPLPLAPFEHYMLADDRADYPMTFFLRLQFRGRFERDRFQRALDGALQMHPLLNAYIRGSPRRRTSKLTWDQAVPGTVQAIWLPDGAPITFPNGLGIDLKRETGLRIWLNEGSETTQLIAQLHHACCDGLGMIQFIETLMECYQSPAKGRDRPEQDTDYAIREQVSRGEPDATWWASATNLVQGIARIGRYLRMRAEPLVVPNRTPEECQPPESTFPPQVTHRFDHIETARIRAAARRLGVNTNALLLRDQILALDDWNRTWAADRRRQSLRIIMPVNLRNSVRVRMPAFNAISLAFVDRNPDQLADPQQLLVGLDTQLNEFKLLRRGMPFLPVLRLLGKIPGMLSLRCQANCCMASSVFSNMGFVFAGSRLLGSDKKLRAGNVVLEQFEVAPPVRPKTVASFAAYNYGNCQSITLCFDAHLLTPNDGQTMLDLFVRRLRDSAGVTANLAACQVGRDQRDSEAAPPAPLRNAEAVGPYLPPSTL